MIATCRNANTSIARYNLTMSRHGRSNSVISIEKRKQACNMIESIITESIPSVHVDQAKKIARQLSSLHVIQDCVDGDCDARLKQTLRLISRKILNVANKKRQDGQTLVATADSLKPVNSLSSSEEEPSAEPSKTSVSSETEATTADSYDHKAKAERHHILINLLGEAKYNEILCITEEINEIRLKSAVWTKFSQEYGLSRQVEVRDYKGTHFEQDRAPASKALPAPIYDIYFRTRLVDAMRVVNARTRKQLPDLPPPCGCVVQRVDWDSLLEDAKANLEAFRNFEKTNILPTDNLSFSCFGGMCARRPS
ncbi:hypothetical protein HJC23_002830 [Cyclotella cryptica]|uniref:Uncharacterized protein n=1 Tax=Cyclotella cryptica TaxID=29204 RepID=A0ABD3PMQ6_9STRA|eukprot:CCRYP_013107-RA/>CCRYP_013107-RA protein AED:0.00 eAED:0.00 QI:432/1/1/1/1/1/2/77/309